MFLRLSGCIEPLCPWCDTPYAWGKGQEMPLHDILGKIRSFQTGFLVITGGEPFLQWDSGVAAIEDTLLAEGWQIQYETSGKVRIPTSCNGVIVCSPKYIDGAWHVADGNTDRADLFKFPAWDNLLQIQKFIETHNIPNEKIWIMPLGATRQEQLDRLPVLWDFCVNNNFQLSSRLHILAFDTQRGI